MWYRLTGYVFLKKDWRGGTTHIYSVYMIEYMGEEERVEIQLVRTLVLAVIHKDDTYVTESE